METNVVINKDFTLDDSIPDESVDCIVTDPPYFILGEDWDKAWKDKDEFVGWLHGVVNKLYRLLKPNRACYIFCSQVYMADTELMLRDTQFRIINRIIWHYPNTTAMYSPEGFKLTWEPCFYLLKGKIPNLKRDEYIDVNEKFFMDVKTYPRCKSTSLGYNKRVHPSQKPLELIQELVQLNSTKGEIILDAFSGSGTTLVAAKLLGRRYIGYEKNPEYLPLIEARLEGLNAIKNVGGLVRDGTRKAASDVVQGGLF